MCDCGSNRKGKSAMRFTVGAAFVLVVGAVSTAGAAQKPASNALVDAVAACQSQQDEITATVASASALGYGKYRVRIEDGAIWETTEGWPTLREPRRGDTVVIKRGSLGSYLMKIDGQRGLKAKRVG